MKHKRVKNEVLPDGEHLLVFRKHIEKKSSKGNEMTAVIFTPINGSPEIIDYITLNSHYGWAKLDGFLGAFGIRAGDDFDPDQLRDLYGVEIRVITKNETFNNLEQTKIEEYLPPDQAQARAAMDEWAAQEKARADQDWETARIPTDLE